MASKTGLELKKSLRLDKYKYVYVSYVYGSMPKIFYVFYDSARDNGSLTKKYIQTFGNVHTHRDGAKYAMEFAPLLPIEQFGGHGKGYFVVYDTAYSRMTRNEAVEKNEIRLHGQIRLKEFLNLSDFGVSGVTSDFTMGTTAQRQQYMGGANKNTKFLDIMIDGKDVVFQFLTEVTDGIYPKDYDYQETDPEKNYALGKNPSKTYEMWIKFMDVVGKDSWLDTYPDKTAITPKDIKEIMEISNVQLFSNDPSFNWQGFAYWLSQKDASVYPQKIKPKRWDKIHGNSALLTKHFTQLFKQLPFFRNQMASSLTKKMKSEGLI